MLFARSRTPLATLFYGSPYGTNFDPRNAILLFFSLLFGPVVGFIVGFFGSSIGNFPFLGLPGYSHFHYYASYGRVWILLLIWLLRGLMGIIMGLAKLPLSDLISSRNLLRIGLFVLFAFISDIIISIFGAGLPPDYPVSILIDEWLRFPNRFENIITELIFTFIYLTIFTYAYFQVSKFIPGIIPPNDSETEKAARDNSELRTNANTVSSTDQKLQTTVEAKKRLYQSWWGRSLLGGLLGIILGVAHAGLINYYYGSDIVIYVIACALAGLITFPHKLSIVLLLLGFFVVGFIAAPDLIFPPDNLGFGAVIGLPAGAFLSRILGWTKVLK
jgi:hypothetical protein